MLIHMRWLMLFSLQNSWAAGDLSAALTHDEACPEGPGQCSLNLLQLHGKQQAWSQGSAFCCHAYTIDSDKCGSCYPQAKAKPGSYCAKASTCAGCGGTWCTGASSQKQIDTSGLIKGISYGPSPKLSQSTLPVDDFFCDAAKFQWGSRGRGDLRIMKAMGANTVRLYGNDPEMEHRDFLHYANLLGLNVVPGISDAPYLAVPQACVRTGSFNCHDTIKDAYLKNLNKGFLRSDNTYHPALSYIIVVNEPDLKLPNLEAPRSFAKAIATAIDGMIDAEHAANVSGQRPNFTATFSFSMCSACTKFADRPALAQMWMLRDAMLHPAKYGISPNNDLAHFYETRFTNTFNTGNPSWEVKKLFLDHYMQEFPSTPVFIGEYHNPGNANTESDLRNILSIAKASHLLLGVSFFEFQNRLDEAGHSIWGIFDPQEDPTITDLGASPDPEEVLFGSTFSVNTMPCLVPTKEGGAEKNIPEQITAAYGGSGIDFKKLCEANPNVVKVSATGYQQIQGLHNVTSMQIFIARVAAHFGGEVASSSSVPKVLAEEHMNRNTTFRDLRDTIGAHPEWARWSSHAACAVDRKALKSRVGNALSYVCGLGYFDCAKIPKICSDNIWARATYVFGSHFHGVAKSFGEVPDPFKECDFEGAAKLESPKQQEVLVSDQVPRDCIVRVGLSVPDEYKVEVSRQSFRSITNAGNASILNHFIFRVVTRMGGRVAQNEKQKVVPTDIADKYLQLAEQDWKSAWKTLKKDIAGRPSWTLWDSSATCMADPKASHTALTTTLHYICGLGKVDCKSVPRECQQNLFEKTSYVLGSYFKALVDEEGSLPDPLRECHFNGRAAFVSTGLLEEYNKEAIVTLTGHCVVPVTI
eukprot:TRINITY_DN28783_c0_g1_i1.p1 TRINITY_DN28783_c0_g1~~TRINITY_DN28783_c0_g1_i1.p1  ORF type:complete len:867 (-),score=151.28 TRINITY_DN28783_c0_g1_i1:155-2755(-)